jgi:hypothetical protein
MEPEVVDLVKALTDLDPFKRLGYRNLELLKSHSFFNDVKWEDFMDQKVVPPVVALVKQNIPVVKTEPFSFEDLNHATFSHESTRQQSDAMQFVSSRDTFMPLPQRNSSIVINM